MKYTDEQRIAKIQETTGKLLAYIKEYGITSEEVLERSIFVGLSQLRYITSGNIHITCQMSLRRLMITSPGQRYPD